MYNLKLRLTRISMITLAKTFWDKAEVVEQIKEFFRKDMKKGRNEWYKDVMKNVLGYLNVLGEIPLKLKMELEEVLVYVGEELHSWYKYLLETMKLDFSYAKVIYLTPFGTIDERQIFEKFWTKNKDSLFQSEDNDVGYGFFDLACMFCQEEFIFKFRNQVINFMKNLFSCDGFFMSETAAGKTKTKLKIQVNHLGNKDDIITVILTHWLNVRHKLRYFDIDDKLQVQKIFLLPSGKFTHSSVDIYSENLQISVEEGYPHVFKFFFNKLSVSLRDRKHDYVVQQCRSKYLNIQLSMYERKRYLEIMFILMDGVSPRCREKIMRDHYKTLLKMMIACWPYQELFIQTFNNAARLELIPSLAWKKILNLILRRDRRDHGFGCPIQRNTHRLILEQIWAQTDEKMKDKSKIFEDLTDAYIDMLNFPMLKIIIDFSSMDEESFNLYTIIYRILDWVKEDKFYLVERFAEEVLKSAEDVERFKNEMKETLIQQLIKQGNYSALEKLMIHLEKFGTKISKIDIDGIEAVASMAKSGECHVADKFLKWLYHDSEEKIVEVKNHCKTEEFCRNCIFEIFAEIFLKLDTAKKSCSKFLKFVCTSEEEIKNHKLNLLFKDEFSVLDFALICDKEYSKRDANSNFFPIRELIEFCEWPNEKVEELKTKCLENIETIMNLYTTKCKCYIVADHLINWLVKSNGKRQRIIKKFMKSPDGLVMCNKILNLDAALNKDTKEIVLRFYNKWVRSCKNISELKENLEDMNKEKLTVRDKIKFAVMFSKLEKGENLKFEEVICYGKESSCDSDDDDDEDWEYDIEYDSDDSFFTWGSVEVDSGKSDKSNKSDMSDESMDELDSDFYNYDGVDSDF